MDSMATRPVARCGWCGTTPVYVAYHDTEWGVPERDGRRLFAKLTLDGFQAGLSWLTILRRRAGMTAALGGLVPERLARFGPARRQRLLADTRIIRHAGKVEMAVGNARAWLRMAEAGEDFAAFVWSFVDGRPRQGRWHDAAEVPTQTAASQALSRALRARGFRYVGPTIVQAFMQAAGLFNDHLWGCFRRPELTPRGGG